jgi:hypothetical protein
MPTVMTASFNRHWEFDAHLSESNPLFGHLKITDPEIGAAVVTVTLQLEDAEELQAYVDHLVDLLRGPQAVQEAVETDPRLWPMGETDTARTD